jgi:hypothetical protein
MDPSQRKTFVEDFLRSGEFQKAIGELSRERLSVEVDPKVAEAVVKAKLKWDEARIIAAQAKKAVLDNDTVIQTSEVALAEFDPPTGGADNKFTRIQELQGTRKADETHVKSSTTRLLREKGIDGDAQNLAAAKEAIRNGDPTNLDARVEESVRRLVERENNIRELDSLQAEQARLKNNYPRQAEKCKSWLMSARQHSIENRKQRVNLL